MNIKLQSIGTASILVSLLLTSALFTTAQGQSEEGAKSTIDNVTNGGLVSLRGRTELDVTDKGSEFKRVPRDRSRYVSDYVYQPPLIPHQIRNYEISTNANKCLTCHSFKNSTESGATKISVTHYATREGAVLSDVSPRRYFCLQCHVVQTDTPTLVDNEFKRVESLR